MRKLFFLAPIISCVVLAACADGKITMTSFDGSKSVTIDAEFAATPTSREQGLMGRTTLAEDSGMLFAFPTPEPLVFWMKNTKIPLEILFFDADGGFVNALQMTPCEKEPCTQYRAAALAQYALEVNPGFRERHGIGVGWKLDLKSVRKNVSPR